QGHMLSVMSTGAQRQGFLFFSWLPVPFRRRKIESRRRLKFHTIGASEFPNSTIKEFRMPVADSIQLFLATGVGRRQKDLVGKRVVIGWRTEIFSEFYAWNQSSGRFGSHPRLRIGLGIRHRQLRLEGDVVHAAPTLHNPHLVGMGPTATVVVSLVV